MSDLISRCKELRKEIHRTIEALRGLPTFEQMMPLALFRDLACGELDNIVREVKEKISRMNVPNDAYSLSIFDYLRNLPMELETGVTQRGILVFGRGPGTASSILEAPHRFITLDVPDVGVRAWVDSQTENTCALHVPDFVRLVGALENEISSGRNDACLYMDTKELLLQGMIEYVSKAFKKIQDRKR